MAGALPRQGEELLLAEADQRRFQEAGQVEIVLRQQHEARRRQQILDGELFAQVQAVDARHFDALALQRAHQGRHELVAPPHQHHEVAGMQQLALARALLLADQALGVGGDQMGEAFVRLRQRALRAFEVGRVGLGLGRADQRPQLDPAGLVLAAGQMLDDMAGLDDALRRGIFTEYPIDRVEHGRGRAEGNIEVDRHEIVLGDAALFGEPLAHLLELARIGALEAEDRLLGVADGEHRAAAFDRALARRRIPRSAGGSPPTGRGWCPAPRRPARGRCRRRACRAPRPHWPRSPGGAASPRSGRRSRAPRAVAWRGNSGRRCRGRAAAAPWCARPARRR